MRVNLPNAPVFGQRELQHQVRVAVTRLGGQDKPMILHWNGEKIITLSLDARRAVKTLEQPTCLGVYDFETTADQIWTDLLAVIAKSKGQTK